VFNSFRDGAVTRSRETQKKRFIGLELYVAVTMALLVPSCKHVTSEVPDMKPTTFSKVEIRTVAPGRTYAKRVLVTQPETLQRVLAFFPRVGSGHRSSIAGFWISAVEVECFREDGTSVTASIDPDFRYWTEGKGDWPLREGFEALLTELLPGGTKGVTAE
jgi:hypothetical protein